MTHRMHAGDHHMHAWRSHDSSHGGSDNLAHHFLKTLHVFLVYDIQRSESVSMMLLAPKSTLMADTVSATLTIHTHLLMVDATLFWLRGGRE